MTRMSSFMERDDQDLTGWLEAEADGRLDDADAFFSGLLARSVPVLSPPFGFATAIVSRAVALRPAPWPWWIRALTAASVVLAGIPLAWLQGLNPFDLVAATGTRLVPLVADLASVMQRVASLAASIWGVSEVLGQAVLAACLTGPGPLIIVVNLALSFVGFLGLRRLLTPPKECW